jgi:hypothetical protein
MPLSNLANPKLVLDATYHCGQAISLVNKRIANANHEVTNATIFAVDCLAHTEVRTILCSRDPCLEYAIITILLDHK